VALKRAATSEEAKEILVDALPFGGQGTTPADFDGLHRWVAAHPEPPRQGIHGERASGAAGVFLLVTISTFPMVLPLTFISDPKIALRTSHAVALTMLFLIGSALARYTGMRAWLTGLDAAHRGRSLLTILLGG
jgi:VIT1/CCC1 family predicted Fe2+/Mn2+ transporter